MRRIVEERMEPRTKATLSPSERGKARNKNNPSEYYPTQEWVTRRLCSSGLIPLSGRFLEPCAGDGAIVRAVNRYCDEKKLSRPSWSAVEIRKDLCAHFLTRAPEVPIVCGDALKVPLPAADVLVTNPAFSIGEALFRRARHLVDYFAILMRVGWLEPRCRARLFRDDMPDLGILSPRPSFVGGKQDNAVYAWLVWRRGVKNRIGRVMLLDREEGEGQIDLPL